MKLNAGFHLAAICALSMIQGVVMAAEPDSYAVVSLVGDSLTIVSYETVESTNLDRNPRQKIALTDDHFDQLATRVALNVIRRANAGSTVQGVALPRSTAGTEDYGDANDLFGAGGKLPALLDSVKPLLKQPDTHYLVVLSKSRGDARLKINSGTIGSGKLTGLGFYVDRVHGMTKTSTGERGRGFLAPYAYVQTTLVDLRTGAVVKSEVANEGTTRANVGENVSLDPWTAFSADEKMRMVDNLLGHAVQQSVAHVVAN